ncbi:terpene synthase family protein [Streptomyces sp. IBSNAI002]|uniref:terpene synthase family protein n=1 Tax=Streptomyces sp. IBSNAI002 TaxID=3457500 RepID=UPI003FD267B8
MGLPERVAHSSCTTSLMFEVDDVALLQRGLFDEIDADWENAQHPYGRAFHDIWSTLRRRMPEGVYQRYRADWQNWFAGAQRENEFRATGQIPDLETYLAVRRSNVGLRPYITCLEYVPDLDLTDDRQQDEYAATLLAHGRTLQEAFDQSAAMVERADARLTDAVAALRRRYASAGPKGRETSAYLDGIGSFCTGNYRWSCETSRYNGTGYGWNGLRTSVVTLHPEHIIIAAP